MKVHPVFSSKKTFAHVPSHKRTQSMGYFTNTPRPNSAAHNKAPPPNAHFFDLGMQACEPCVSSTTGANWCVYPSVITWSGEDRDITTVAECREYLNTNLSAVRRRAKPPPHPPRAPRPGQGGVEDVCAETCDYVAPEDIDKKACEAGDPDARCTPGWGTCAPGGKCGFVALPGTNVCDVQPLGSDDEGLAFTCCDGVTSFATQQACENAHAPPSEGFEYLPQCTAGEAPLGCCWTTDMDCQGMFSE